MTKETTEELFKNFLNEYFENIKTILPNSYRAQQLKAGGYPADAVRDFETRFLSKPFAEAIKLACKRMKKSEVQKKINKLQDIKKRLDEVRYDIRKIKSIDNEISLLQGEVHSVIDDLANYMVKEAEDG